MPGRYLMYLRKSRQDDPNETVQEVLTKHEIMLQEYAEKELGGRIPEENIYREVVSGESIDDRVEIQKVLLRIEDPAVRGVLVKDAPRLSRGDLEDCGRLINDLRYTHTRVVTPMMTFDLEKKMERKFFQDELLRGRDFLEYVKETLYQGRVNAVKRGCYITATPPTGYNRVKIGKDWTLEPNDDADLVRLIFKMYVEEGLTTGGICRRLDDLGYKPPRADQWGPDTIREMLRNVHYAGYTKFNEVKRTWVVEHGERVLRRLNQPKEEIIIAEGKHEAIIDRELFEAAQTRLFAGHRTKKSTKLVNVLAGVLRCAGCGKVMVLDRRKGAQKRYMCRHRPQCYKSALAVEVVEAVIVALEQVELPKLQAKLKNGDGDAAIIQKRRLEKLLKQMDEYRDQEESQYELLETRKYTQEVFDRRNAVLRAKMEECEKEIHLTRSAMPKNVDYTEKIVKLEEAIAGLRDESIPVETRNRLLRVIIDRIEFSSEDLGFNKTGVHLEVFLKI